MTIMKCRLFSTVTWCSNTWSLHGLTHGGKKGCLRLCSTFHACVCRAASKRSACRMLSQDACLKPLLYTIYKSNNVCSFPKARAVKVFHKRLVRLSLPRKWKAKLDVYVPDLVYFFPFISFLAEETNPLVPSVTPKRAQGVSFFGEFWRDDHNTPTTPTQAMHAYTTFA